MLHVFAYQKSQFGYILEWTMLVHFMAIRYNLRLLSKCYRQCSRLVNLFPVLKYCTKKIWQPCSAVREIDRIGKRRQKTGKARDEKNRRLAG
jgi:hypothetical protein